MLNFEAVRLQCSLVYKSFLIIYFYQQFQSSSTKIRYSDNNNFTRQKDKRLWLFGEGPLFFQGKGVLGHFLGHNVISHLQVVQQFLKFQTQDLDSRNYLLHFFPQCLSLHTIFSQQVFTLQEFFWKLPPSPQKIIVRPLESSYNGFSSFLVSFQSMNCKYQLPFLKRNVETQ